jgi:hypothetical protein
MYRLLDWIDAGRTATQLCVPTYGLKDELAAIETSFARRIDGQPAA